MAHSDSVPSRPGDNANQADKLRLVVFSVEGHRYGLNLYMVERILPMVEVTPLPKAPAVALGVFNLHGAIIPILDMRRRFSLPAHEYGLTARLLIATTPKRRLALPVDEVMGVTDVATEIVTKPDAILPAIGQVAGIVALPDGLLFIHDLETMLSLEEEERLTEALKGTDP